MAEQIKRVTARTDKSGYDILIGNGVLASISDYIGQSSTDRVVALVSSRVYELHGEYINRALGKVHHCDCMLVDDSEENKNYHYAEHFLQRFLDAGLTRKSMVIAIGGGVVGDFAGFCAALYMRGIPLIHVPTTLLAMVDSSIGGKVAVNLHAGKNIAGAFHQPFMVLSDLSFLRTLDNVDIRNGLTEALKHGLIGEAGTLRLLEQNDYGSIMTENSIFELICLSVIFKSSIVQEDEREGGIRAILNFGHTIGHAIESLMGYKNISHGQAVAVGMRAEMNISEAQGLLPESDMRRAHDLFNAYGLSETMLSLDPDDIIEHLKFDKKITSGRSNFVLLNGIGNALINQHVEDGTVREVLSRFCKT